MEVIFLEVLPLTQVIDDFFIVAGLADALGDGEADAVGTG